MSLNFLVEMFVILFVLIVVVCLLMLRRRKNNQKPGRDEGGGGTKGIEDAENQRTGVKTPNKPKEDLDEVPTPNMIATGKDKSKKPNITVAYIPPVQTVSAPTNVQQEKKVPAQQFTEPAEDLFKLATDTLLEYRQNATSEEQPKIDGWINALDIAKAIIIENKTLASIKKDREALQSARDGVRKAQDIMNLCGLKPAVSLQGKSYLSM